MAFCSRQAPHRCATAATADRPRKDRTRDRCFERERCSRHSSAERKACDATHQAARTLVFSEHILQLRSEAQSRSPILESLPAKHQLRVASATEWVTELSL